MIYHNLKQIIRGILKNKVYSFLNIVGFAVGFAVCIIIAIYAYREYSVDTSFKNSENIYRLVDKTNNTVGIDSDVVIHLKKFPEINRVIPVYYANWEEESTHEFLLDVETGNSIQTGNFIESNNDFFPLFNLKTLISKTEKPFIGDKSIVLTRSLAIQLFGQIDVIDKVVKKDDALFTVSAVVEDMPENSSLYSEFFIRHDNPNYVVAISSNGEEEYYRRNIYIQLNEETKINEIIAKLNSKFPKNKSNTQTVSLQPLKDIYLDKSYGMDDNNRKSNKSIIWIFITVAILTLVMSIFNYANFIISRQLAALKNTGIRVTNGAKRRQIIAYYLTEIFVAVLIAFLLALLISKIGMPYAEQLLDKKLEMKWLLRPKLLALHIVLFTIVIALSSIAPIVFISKLKVQTLFGKTTIKTGNYSIKKAMNSIQLTISIVLLIAVFTVNKQLDFVKNAEVGFNTSHLLKLDIPWGYENTSSIKNEFNKLPFVENLSLTSNAPGSGWNMREVSTKNGENMTIYVVAVDQDFLQTFGMELLKGREFENSEINNDSFYLTEYAFNKLGWTDLDKVKMKNGNNVVGVVNDIFYNSMHDKMVPVGFVYTNNYLSTLNLKLSSGNLFEQMKTIKKTWIQLMDNEPFSFSFYDQYFDSLYKKEEKQSAALTLFALIVFLITCLGLLSQVLQSTQSRIKEIGIRKINGATIKEVLFLLNKEFLWTVAIAFVIATPIAYYAMHKWLGNFAYKTALSWWIFVLAGLIALVVSMLTVSWQSYRAASSNPVEALRNE